MNESEDTLDMFEAKGKAYDEGCVTGLLWGIPMGTLITLIIVVLTMNTWLPYFR